MYIVPEIFFNPLHCCCGDGGYTHAFRGVVSMGVSHNTHIIMSAVLIIIICCCCVCCSLLYVLCDDASIF